MKNLILTVIALIITATPALAKHKIDVKVKGMVCEMCAQKMWGEIGGYDEVEKVDIDLETGIVAVILKDGQSLNEEQLNEAIIEAGYELIEVTLYE